MPPYLSSLFLQVLTDEAALSLRDWAFKQCQKSQDHGDSGRLPTCTKHCEMDTSLRSQKQNGPKCFRHQPVGLWGWWTFRRWGAVWSLQVQPCRGYSRASQLLLSIFASWPSEGKETTSGVFSCHDALDSHRLKVMEPGTFTVKSVKP